MNCVSPLSRLSIMTPHICGLCPIGSQKQFLPLVDTKAHTTILDTTSRTILTQKYLNPSASEAIRELRYTFPLYDGVSVVGFVCRIGDRTIVGQVMERQQAKKVFKDAVIRGDKAALLEQLPSASDVFTTTVGNVPAGVEVVVEITYVGELKHDAEVNGLRFTIPTSIMPRYGSLPVELNAKSAISGGRLQVTVDIVLAQSNVIQRVQSPSHPITVSIGTTSFAPNANAVMSKASATLSLGDAALDKDFIIQVVSKDTGVPTAILETHPRFPNQRALMTTLVPKFALPAERPELVFICDCSGSMSGSNIDLVRSALKVLLKSLPVGIKFNLCSFGSSYSFLWPTSATYSQTTLNQAVKHVESMSADLGGTEMFQPIKAALDRRYKDIPLAVMLLTDGEVWDQDSLFAYLNKEIIETNAPIRVFTLGIGNGVSHALIEGVAKAGNGFSQSVGEGEKMEGKVVRMLKGALTPHVVDYTLEVRYASAEVKIEDMDDDDFEIVEKVIDSLSVAVNVADDTEAESESVSMEKKPISLFDPSVDLDLEEKELAATPENIDMGEAAFASLPAVTPKLLQTPHIIPPLYAFNRTNVYLLMSQQCSSLTPKSVVLRGVSRYGPLEIEIPIQVLDTPGETIHQLAAKSAIAELEQGRGWITQLRDKSDGQLFRMKYESRFADMVEREAIRLGVQFQVGGRWCSFVATETNKESDNATRNEVELPLVVTKETGVVDVVKSSDFMGSSRSRIIHSATSAGAIAIVARENEIETREQVITTETTTTTTTTTEGETVLEHVQKDVIVDKTVEVDDDVSVKVEKEAKEIIITKETGKVTKPAISKGTSWFRKIATTTGAAVVGAGAVAVGAGVLAVGAAKGAASGAGHAAHGALEKVDGAWKRSVPVLTTRKAHVDKVAPIAKTSYVYYDDEVYDAVLTEKSTGVAYVIQLLFDHATAKYYVYFRWGETDYRLDGPHETVESAKAVFQVTYQEQFGVQWHERETTLSERFIYEVKTYETFETLEEVEVTTTTTQDDVVSGALTLMDLQTFEGFWEWQESLFSWVGVDPKLAEAVIKKHGWDFRVAATAFAIVFLEKKQAKEKDTWELVVEKAKGWMEEKIGVHMVEEVLHKVVELVK
ncbi:hypothetical protein KI688_007577 [Linnemannia hyalina]|uniref:Uncharacterized protein n=1 Tax=Linnemannia hyalina TaxID=64524 RepID=A0A9P8BM35_9FUNG|nr:hypothetical protein KI688_007577 [Linnemannia hyalina]